MRSPDHDVNGRRDSDHQPDDEGGRSERNTAMTCADRGPNSQIPDSWEPPAYEEVMALVRQKLRGAPSERERWPWRELARVLRRRLRRRRRVIPTTSSRHFPDTEPSSAPPPGGGAKAGARPREGR